MKMPIFFLLTALLGIVSCDLMCMQFKQAPCSTMIRVRDASDPFCSSITERVECISNAAQECDVESSPIVREVIKGYLETCKKGTKMNQLYEKHKSCVFHDTITGNVVCSRSEVEKAEALGFPSQTRAYLEEFLSVSCKYRVSVNRCVDDNVNSVCGTEAAEFRHQLSEPSIRLSKQVCEEAGFEPADKSGANINESLQLVYVLVAAICTKYRFLLINC